MNRREKILAIAVGSVLGLVLLYGLVNQLLLQPARSKSQQAARLRGELEALRQQNVQLSKAKQEYVALRDQTFDDSPNRVSVRLNERITQLARQAGLSQESIKLIPFPGKTVAESYREVGWGIEVATSLEKITNLLYLLEKDSYLHRITGLTFIPKQGSRDVNCTIRYSSLALEGQAIDGLTSRPAASQPFVPPPSLDDPARASYNVIAQRNLFLPYVPRPPDVPVNVAVAPQPQERAPATASPAWWESLVVKGLPSIGAEHEVHVAPPGGDIKKALHVGDDVPMVPPAKIAMVDYRVLPMPGKPLLESPGRMILKIKDAYWAVELGQQISQRRQLKPDDLPEPLRTQLSAASQPAAAVAPSVEKNGKG